MSETGWSPPQLPHYLLTLRRLVTAPSESPEDRFPSAPPARRTLAASVSGFAEIRGYPVPSARRYWMDALTLCAPRCAPCHSISQTDGKPAERCAQRHRSEGDSPITQAVMRYREALGLLQECRLTNGRDSAKHAPLPLQAARRSALLLRIFVNPAPALHPPNGRNRPTASTRLNVPN